jgi:hypothetical protein
VGGFPAPENPAQKRGRKFDKAIERALGFARSEDAVYLPGWCGPID